MLKHDAMLDALRKKKGTGVDLTIILGDDDKDHEDDEKLGLAPDVKEDKLGEEAGVDKDMVMGEKEDGMEVPSEEDVLDPMHKDEAQDKSLFRKLLEDAGPQGELGKLALARRKK